MSAVGGSASRLREVLQYAAERPGMYMLQEDYRQAVAFVMGCVVSAPDLFNHLQAWSITRIRGARDKYGWPYALAVLAADRASRRDWGGEETKAPLVREFLSLVCEYLADLEADDGAHPGRVRTGET